MIMVCVGFVSRSEEPRPRRALAHDSLLARRARPDDQGLWPPPAFSRGGSQAEPPESQERLGTLGRGPAGCHRQRLRGTCAVAPQRRRLLANCAGGSRPLQRLLANLAGGSRRWLQRVLANCAGDSQRLLAGADLVELAGLAELAE
jgi:hypothetical protein